MHHHNSKSHTLGFEPGASGVRRPCARPLGNLTTVGHLAKVSPDLSPHFHIRNMCFDTMFRHKNKKNVFALFSDTNTQIVCFLTSFPDTKTQKNCF